MPTNRRVKPGSPNRPRPQELPGRRVALCAELDAEGGIPEATRNGARGR